MSICTQHSAGRAVPTRAALSFLMAVFLSLLAPFCCAQPYTIATVAGGGTVVPGQQPVPAAQARLVAPIGVAVNAAGNLFIADTAQLTELTGANLVALTTPSDAPWGVAVDSTGNTYIADAGVNVIRMINPSGSISTFAGNGTAGYSGDGGPATSAKLQNPLAVAVDPAGNVYIADSANHVVRKVSNGVITTFAGGGSGVLTGSAPATSVFLTETDGLTFDPAGNLYITSRSGFYVYKVTPAGTISIFAGNGNLSNSGDGGPATAAGIFDTTGVAVDAAGNVVIASESGCVIREVTRDGVIHTIAGNGTCGYSGDGGPATSAQIGDPWGLAASGTQIYVADRANHVVRLLTTGANIGGGPPTITEVDNAFSNIPNSPIQSGAWVAIKGTNLSNTNPGRGWNANESFPTTMDGTSVTINNKPAFLYFISPTQVNVQAPTDTALGPVSVVVTNSGQVSASATAQYQSNSPALLQWGGGQYSYALITRGSDYIGNAAVVSGTVSAKAGDSLTLWATGLGATNPPLPAGQQPSAFPPVTTMPTVTVAGTSVTVLGAVLRYAGLYQVNIQLPASLPTGDSPIKVIQGSFQSPGGILINIQP